MNAAISIYARYSLLLSLLLSSCATIFNGKNQRIPVVGPQEPVLIEANGSPLIIYQRMDSSRYVEIPRKNPVLITTTFKNRTDSLLLEPKLQAGWIIAGIFTYGVSLIIDNGTGSWNTFGDEIIIYGIPDSTLLKMIAANTRQKVLILEGFDSTMFRRGYQPIGVDLKATMGFHSNTEQIPVLPPNIGLMIGYNFNNYFSASLNYDYNGCINCVDYQGDIRSTGYCDIGIENVSLIARAEIEGVFLGLHGGYSTIESGRMRNINTKKDVPGFAANIPSFGWSIGYRGPVAFIEYRKLYGTERFAVGEGSTAVLRVGTIRCGIGATF